MNINTILLVGFMACTGSLAADAVNLTLNNKSNDNVRFFYQTPQRQGTDFVEAVSLDPHESRRALPLKGDMKSLLEAVNNTIILSGNAGSKLKKTFSTDDIKAGVVEINYPADFNKLEK